ncbi:hypothetical protein [Gordonia polyisoprenivorans]|uniref:hypothetical protein n=1 Tax=Gordonia polyisoprenivorans TaxID=84595 RepID=UPI0012DD1E44|nr:hypothetical protein [Gordonia polyisoprenivorans]
MRTVLRTAAVASLAAATFVIPVATAQAAGPPPTAIVGTPHTNTAVVSITNNLDDVTSCGARLYGIDEYDTPYTRTPARTTITFSITNVPAGNYSIWWACNGHTGDKRFLVVGGNPRTNGKPYTDITYGNSPSSAIGTGFLSGLLSGLLGSS